YSPSMNARTATANKYTVPIPPQIVHAIALPCLSDLAGPKDTMNTTADSTMRTMSVDDRFFTLIGEELPVTAGLFNQRAVQVVAYRVRSASRIRGLLGRPEAGGRDPKMGMGMAKKMQQRNKTAFYETSVRRGLRRGQSLLSILRRSWRLHVWQSFRPAAH